MLNQIQNLLDMLDAEIEDARDKAKAAVASLTAEMIGAVDDGSVSQTSLLQGIKGQIGVAMMEVERFKGAVPGQLGTAEAFARSLVKNAPADANQPGSE